MAPTPPPITQAEQDYDGPQPLKKYADLMPFLGELAISFSLLEQGLTAAIGDVLGIEYVDAVAIEDSINSLALRITLFEFAAKPLAVKADAAQADRPDWDKKHFVAQLQDVVVRLREENKFRNLVFHNPFLGMSYVPLEAGQWKRSVAKRKNDPKIKKPDYWISSDELREHSIKNVDLYREVFMLGFALRNRADDPGKYAD